MKVGGLDLARRSDFSALVTLEIGSGPLTVTRALRLPQETYDRQLKAVAPIIAELDLLAYDAGGVGDAVGERLPAKAIPVIIVPGDRSPLLRNGRWRIGKISLIQNLLGLGATGRLVVPPDLPGAEVLRQELEQFAVLPTRKGAKLGARGRAHDDLVLALALAVIAVHLRRAVGMPPSIRRVV